MLAEELAAAGAFYPIAGLGLMMLGPTLLEFGSEEQKLRHLPADRARRAAMVPGLFRAGRGFRPRLAAHALRRHGTITGWSTARKSGPPMRITPTGASAWPAPAPRSKQGGISFLLIDMKTPGVEVAADHADQRRLAFLRDLLHRCRKCPRKTWSARSTAAGRWPSGCSSSSATAFPRCAAPIPDRVDLPDLARRYCGTDDTGRIADADLRLRLADHLMGDHAYRLTLERRAREAGGGAEAIDAGLGAQEHRRECRPAARRAGSGNARQCRPRLGHAANAPSQRL